MISSDRKIAAWSGKMKFEDTALAVADSGGPGIPLLYLNGSYADRSHWRRVISELGVSGGTSPTTSGRVAARRPPPVTALTRACGT